MNGYNYENTILSALFERVVRKDPERDTVSLLGIDITLKQIR